MQLFAIFEMGRLELWFLRKLDVMYGLSSSPGGEEREEGCILYQGCLLPHCMAVE